MLRHRQILLIKCNLGQHLPIRLSIRGHIQRVQNGCCLLQIPRLNGETKLNQGLIQLVCCCATISLIDYYFSFARSSFDFLNITFDVVESDLIGVFDWVPHTKVVSVLGHYHLGIGNPLDVITVGQQCVLLAGANIVEVELSSFVPE